MKHTIEEFGQVLLAIMVGTFLVYFFWSLLNAASAF